MKPVNEWMNEWKDFLYLERPHYVIYNYINYITSYY